MVESMTTDIPTHRVLRPFPIDGVLQPVGTYISDAGWSYQGRLNVEGKKMVERLSSAEIKDWMDEHEPTTDAPVAEKAPAVKKARKAPVRKAVKKTAL